MDEMAMNAALEREIVTEIVIAKMILYVEKTIVKGTVLIQLMTVAKVSLKCHIIR